MAGENTKNRSADARPSRIRPHWWAVLAVSLSLLALVAASAAKGPGNKSHQRDAVTGPFIPPATGSTPLLAPITSTTEVGPGTSTATSSPPTTVGVSLGTSEAAAHIAVRQPIPTTTTIAPTVTTSTTAAVANTPAQPVAQTVTQTGELQQPDDSAASYAFTGVGSMRVSATWPSTIALSLTVNCPGATQSSEGPSSVAVVIANGTGPCDLTLKEVLVQYEAVAYTLTIAPTDGE